MNIVLPGDSLDLPALGPSAVIKLGPGVRLEDGRLHAMIAGNLHTQQQPQAWISGGCGRRYVPAVGEPVVGTVVARGGDMFKVDIGSAQSATLSAMAFEGATKRNRPNLAIGAVVYGRITAAQKDLEPEMECVNPATSKADGFGELSDGFVMTRVSLSLCRRLLLDGGGPEVTLLEIGKNVPFELAIGANGRIWIKAAKPQNTVAITNAIRESEHLTSKEARAVVKKLFFV
ncbi:hypothetical protein GQ42DRAFT_129171 [Ramicandelaber brevisporus]|nr:hypothetical protein GQ42DRAFT_129171 [Ramicandelaber brevisporus]